MKTAIIGVAGSGKSDLFAALAGPDAARAGSRGMVKVPEPRLDPLIALFKPKKTTYSEIEYLDLPGGGSGHGLAERAMVDVRPCDSLVAVLDAFSGLSDPVQQHNIVESDLIVADLAVVEKRLERLAADKRKNRDFVDPAEEEALHRAMALLEQEKPLRDDPELAGSVVLRGFQFLSAKPVLYAWNVAEGEEDKLRLPDDGVGQAHIALSARLERELAELTDPEERAMFLADLGIKESALDRVVAISYRLLGLISYFTAGDKEVRAWPVRKGAKAPEAAGVIHSDFQKGFIRAEVLGYADFLRAKDMKKAKELGLMRLEGKEYVVQDADIVEFRFNV